MKFLSNIGLTLFAFAIAASIGGCMQVSQVPAAAPASVSASRDMDAIRRAIDHARKSGICSAHDGAMAKGRVPVPWGWVVENGEDDEIILARQLEFPFSKRLLEGASPIEQEFSDIYLCAQCDAAKARWIESHPSHPWSQAQQRAKPNPNP